MTKPLTAAQLRSRIQALAREKLELQRRIGSVSIPHARREKYRKRIAAIDKQLPGLQTRLDARREIEQAARKTRNLQAQYAKEKEQRRLRREQK